MTTTRYYTSADSGAPVINGVAGAIPAALDAILVTGYGSKTAAGWGKPYTGTNKAAFQNSAAAGGTNMFVRVEHAGAGTGGARNATARSYATMSDVDTGTVETPTVAQVASGAVWRASNTADSTARAWIAAADELSFVLCVDTGTNTANGCGVYAAGDFQSLVASDPYRFFIIGRETLAGASDNGTHSGICTIGNTLCTTQSSYGIWLARGHAGTGSPIRAGIAMPSIVNDGFLKVIGASAHSIAASAPGSGLAHWVPAMLTAEGTIRGFLRGIYAPLTSRYGVAMGTAVVDPPGLTGTLREMLHYAHANSATVANYDGHISVLADQPWPI